MASILLGLVGDSLCEMPLNDQKVQSCEDQVEEHSKTERLGGHKLVSFNGNQKEGQCRCREVGEEERARREG